MHNSTIVILICIASIVSTQFVNNKRAINGQLRRSSIRWGKRASDSIKELEIYPDGTFDIANWGDEKANSDKTELQASTWNNDVENVVMERVAKGEIRPKLALSSRLWGRR